MEPGLRPAKFNRWNDIWNLWDSWLRRENLTPIQACLRYVNNLSAIDRIVVGVNSIDQLNQILEAINGDMPNLTELNILQDKRLINPANWNQF
jgi:predicted aldo/keto reductase-like oxidoreductase